LTRATLIVAQKFISELGRTAEAEDKETVA
jgi:hypothetical protein